MGQTKAQRIIKQLAGKVQKQTPIASDMFLPNHSGDHSAGKTGTPVNELDLVNKKYVDSLTPSIKLNEVANPDGDTTFTFNSNKHLHFRWTGDFTGDDGGFEIEAFGAFTGDLVHIHQHTGNPGAVDMVHLETDDADVCPLHIISAGGSVVIEGTTLNMSTQKIINVVDPTSNQEVATKKYVDDNAGGGEWTRDGDDIYYNDGGVGIGTDDPTGLFHIKSTTDSIGPIIQTTAANRDAIFILWNDAKYWSFGNFGTDGDKFKIIDISTTRFEIEGDGTLNVSGTTDYENLVTHDDDIPNKKYVDDNEVTNYLKDDAADIGVGLQLTQDNSSVDTQFTPQVLYNTDATPPTASNFPIGTIYIQYTP